MHVVYGIVGLKTHCKLSLVVRQEKDGLRRYCHVGTGNYHPKTARLYEDLGLLTADPEVGADVANLFNLLSGYSMNTDYAGCLVAPDSVRTGLIERIEREIANHVVGLPAWILIKVNSIVDEAIIDALYRASLAGVPVDLWIRGICAVRPGCPACPRPSGSAPSSAGSSSTPGSSRSANGGRPEVLIGSADLMHRNLDRRVETLVRLDAQTHIDELNALLDLGFDEGTSSWHLLQDGTWERHAKDPDGEPLEGDRGAGRAREERRVGPT